MKIITILGTRPEIIKLSPLIPILDREFEHKIIHTGQHYDYNMDEIFFEELQLRKPDYPLCIGSHPAGKQTGLMLEKIEEVLLQEKPDLVIVQGDTNTVLAGSLAAVKLHFPLMHIEAGCRSFNRNMPEEINRVVADHISNYLISPDDKSTCNLQVEGIPAEKIFHLGSTAFDASLRNKEFVDVNVVMSKFGLIAPKNDPLEKAKPFVLVTIHRAENTDDLVNLKELINGLNAISDKIQVVFPIHPRTRKILEQNNLKLNPSIKLIEPQSYLSFLALLSSCRFCMSDSGGIQEEALVFNKPCLVLRNETEWVRLVEVGKNILVGVNATKIINTAETLLDEKELQKIKELKSPYSSGASSKIIELIKEVKRIKEAPQK